MIIWNGKGYLIAIIVFCCSLIGELISEKIYNDDTYYQAHSEPFAIALLTSGIITSTLAHILERRAKYGKLIDKETGEEVVIRSKDLFFFIPIKYWGPMLILSSLFVLIFKCTN